MSGDVHVQFCERPGVRFPRATHLVVGCQRKEDAEQFLRDLKERLGQFALDLHPDKTRLIEFGRFARRHLVSCLSSSMHNSSPFRNAETPLIPHQGADRIMSCVSGTAH